MIIDFRYHVASLVAIFIALALGILIGSTLIGDDLVNNMAQEQQLWIGRLEKDYQNLRKETAGLRMELSTKQNELSYYQSFVKNVKPYLISNKLQGQKFAIVEIDSQGLLNDLTKALEESGAAIVSSTRINVFPALSEKEKYTEISQALATLLVSGEYGEYLQTLEQQGVLNSFGKYGEGIDGIIVVSGYKDENNFFLAIHDAFTNITNLKIPLFFIGSNKYNHGRLERTWLLNNLETEPGQISLILSIFESKDLQEIKVDSHVSGGRGRNEQ
ncbi:MAG: copper transporter [Bacillota bacterium]